MASGVDRTHERVSAVIHDINRVLVDAESVQAIERGVCERLAASEPYLFAWVGRYDPGSDEVVPRASGGVSDDYLEDISIRVHESPDDAGPTATAVRTGTVQVLQDIESDPDYEPWRESALERGFESSAAVPLVADGERYGVLNVYAERPQAFGDHERQLLTELAETVATAIAGVQARRRLAAEQAKYRRLAERISDAYYAVDEEWRITYWNEQMATRTGTDAADVRGEVLWEAFPELLDTENERQYRAAMETGEHRSFETYLGEPYESWVEVEVYPDEDGLSVLSREVTDRKERRRELERYERIFETIPLAVGQNTLGEGARIQHVNEAAVDLFGADSVTELVGMDPGELYADGENRAAFADRLREDGEVVGEEYEFVALDGETFVGEVTATVETVNSEQTVIASIADVSERKNRQRQLQQANRRLSAVIENTSEVIHIKDRDGVYRLMNQAGADLFGLDPEEVVGKTDADLFEAESAAAVRAVDKEILETGRPVNEETVRYIDGQRHVFLDNKFPYRGPDGDIVGIIGVSRDITDRKRDERELQRQRDGLEVLNEMVRHDIRNDLQVILLYAELLASDLDGTDRDRAETVVSKAEAAISLTRTARDLAETMLQSDRDPEPIELRSVLQQQLSETRSTHGSARVSAVDAPPSVTVVADEMIHSVFRNLLYNAIQHNDAEVPEVALSVEVGAETVTVSVADNGPGVPDGQKQDVFGRGEKGLESEGTGIGLYLVDTLVDGYGGEVWVEDRPEGAYGINGPGGAVFVVELQRA